MPLFVRAAISGGADDDLAANVVHALDVLISKMNPPDCLPQTKGFDRSQTEATLAFLTFVRDEWYADTAYRPRGIDRAIRNWNHF